ncbi:hypothetical protein GC089_02445 [Cellulomonas sp. JZ18]|uniref:leucine-rich repeat domain-containing protein n=1 Tax=Cellulomonas sp. JZ18 TaxID=2654191 RepID=UPI0012D4AED8|nr:leucine-rich repeat domain-containing protein [Cellulomonas sp. JZ18]QGQ18327.1 hypothetical protein GC089_02445 [Cellulomonas sp. JZ18]
MRLALLSPRTAVVSVGAWAPLGLAALGVAAALAATGALRRRRGPVLAAAVVVAASAALTALQLLARAAVDLVVLVRYDVPPASAVPWDLLLCALVAGVAAVVALVVAVRVRVLLPDWLPARVLAQGPAGRRRYARRTAVAWCSGIVVLVLAVAGTAAWRAAPREALADVVPDAALRACVATALGADPDASVSERALADVRTLECPGAFVPEASGGAGGGCDVDPDRCVRDLTGLERLGNLAGLDLAGQAVTDLAPLAGLEKLGTLTLTDTPVADLGPLAGLPVLVDLGLSGTAVHDVTPLASVPTLRFLGLARTPLADVGPLAGSGVVELDLSGTRVSDVAPLAAATGLTRLDLSRAQVVDPSPLAALPALTMLNVRGNRVADAATLADLPAVDELWLGENPVTDLRPLLRMPSLLGVDVEGLDPATPGIPELRAAGVHVGGLA